ncbi:hypothetical protein CCH79_00014467 [Gambusia affinis]|uniref:Uncharacterized protein n=1 Tax=Gambusia affinis TaxID=33528 RepID=A0A315UWX5_GAMAF|nr:hypothetical protein CCH79_00014467 [Gambusia affinis]
MICNELCFCFCPGADCAETVKIVDLKGLPSKELAAEIVFDFPIETLGQCAGFLEARPQRKEFPFGGGEYLHIWQAESFACYVAEFTNLSHVILNGRDIILQSTPTDDPSALSNLYILTGHESSY